MGRRWPVGPGSFYKNLIYNFIFNQNLICIENLICKVLKGPGGYAAGSFLYYAGEILNNILTNAKACDLIELTV